MERCNQPRKHCSAGNGKTVGKKYITNNKLKLTKQLHHFLEEVFVPLRKKKKPVLILYYVKINFPELIISS